MRVFDAQNGVHLLDIGKRGTGPGEFNLPSMSPIPHSAISRYLPLRGSCCSQWAAAAKWTVVNLLNLRRVAMAPSGQGCVHGRRGAPDRDDGGAIS